MMMILRLDEERFLQNTLDTRFSFGTKGRPDVELGIAEQTGP